MPLDCDVWRRRGRRERGLAAVEGPLSGKEWRGEKMGAKVRSGVEESVRVGEGRRGGFREKKEGGG